jgi:hypothetical protein
VNLLDVAFAPLRAVLGGAGREVGTDLRDIEHIQTRVLDTAESIKRATETIEAHVVVIESLVGAIPPLTQAVVELTRQLAELNQVLAPMAGVERDVSRFEHLFGRRRQQSPPDASSA